MKNILITGISGQDGLFLTKLLIKNNEKFNILGLTRGVKQSEFYKKLKMLGLEDFEKIKLINIDYQNQSDVDNLLNSYKPDMIYNLMGPSSVYESINYPENKRLLTSSFEIIINSLIKSKNYCKFFQASSSEMFEASESSLDENANMKPRSPYAQGKLQNHLKIKELKENYDWDIYSGIMFNHESEFRPGNYLIMKIINQAISISNLTSKELLIGSTNYIRDWSYAGDVANAMTLICNQGTSIDYVIGSGRGTDFKYILDFIFKYFNLNWEEHVIVDESLLRAGDPIKIVSNPEKIYNELGWKTTLTIEEILERCINSRL